PVVIANCYQNAARPRVNGATADSDVGPHVEIELLESLLRFTSCFRIEAAGDSEHQKQEQGESHSRNRRNLFCEQVSHGDKEKSQRGCEQPDRDFTIAESDVKWSLVFLIVAPESQYENAERLHEKTPDDAECVCLAQKLYVAAAGDNRDDLKSNN